MLASGVNDKGEYENVVDLNISVSDFRKAANIIGHESVTNDRQEILNFAHASLNEAKALKVNVADLLSTGFSSVSASDKVELFDNDNSTKALYSRAGMIHALSGGVDPTDGARRWDGTDFLAWGTDGPYRGGHQKLREIGVEINEAIYNNYLGANKRYWGASVRYGDKRYQLPHSTFNNKKKLSKFIIYYFL